MEWIGMIFVPKEFCSESDRFDHPDLVRSRAERAGSSQD